jgi:hypothetical protein
MEISPEDVIEVSRMSSLSGPHICVKRGPVFKDFGVCTISPYYGQIPAY